MRRWMWSVFFATGLALVACASGDKKKEPGTEQRQMSPAEILTAGQWGQDALRDDQITFMEDGTYVWHRTTACGKPPCPGERVSGTWKVQHETQLYLTPDGGELTIYDFEFGQTSNDTLYLKDQSGKTHEFYR